MGDSGSENAGRYASRGIGKHVESGRRGWGMGESRKRAQTEEVEGKGRIIGFSLRKSPI